MTTQEQKAKALAPASPSSWTLVYRTPRGRFFRPVTGLKPMTWEEATHAGATLAGVFKTVELWVAPIEGAASVEEDRDNILLEDARGRTRRVPIRWSATSEVDAREVEAATVPGTEGTVTITKAEGKMLGREVYITHRTAGHIDGLEAFPESYLIADASEANARETANRLWSEANEAAKAVWRKLHPGAPTAPADGLPPAGRYAVEMDGQLRFFHVDRPTEGRWAGYVFVSQQAGDDLYPVKNPHGRARVLLAISVDPEAAARRYGRELGVCGVCGRTLTNSESRAAGIGPICAGRF